MRRSVAGCGSGLAVAAVLLTACGGSDGEDAASSGSSASSASSGSPEPSTTSSGAAESAAGSSGSEFCAQAEQLQEQISTTFTGASDPNTLPTVLQDAAGRIREIDAPAELAADWATFGNGIEQVAAAAAGVDFTDPDAVTGFQQELARLQGGFGESFANVDVYLNEQCGLGPGATEPASPTS